MLMSQKPYVWILSGNSVRIKKAAEASNIYSIAIKKLPLGSTPHWKPPVNTLIGQHAQHLFWHGKALIRSPKNVALWSWKIRSDTNKISRYLFIFSFFFHPYSKGAQTRGSPLRWLWGRDPKKARYNSAALHQVFAAISFKRAPRGTWLNMTRQSIKASRKIKNKRLAASSEIALRVM